MFEVTSQPMASTAERSAFSRSASVGMASIELYGKMTLSNDAFGLGIEVASATKK